MVDAQGPFLRHICTLITCVISFLIILLTSCQLYGRRKMDEKDLLAEGMRKKEICLQVRMYTIWHPSCE